MDPNDTFPLDYVLSLHSVTADYILPLIEPIDLARLEAISKGCNDAIKRNELWTTKISDYIRDNEVAKRIFTLLDIDTRQLLDESPKFLYNVLVTMKRKIALNLRENMFACLSFTCNDAVEEGNGDKYYRAITIHNNGSYFFAAHDKNIDVLTYGDKSTGENRLELFHHVSWGQAEAEDMEEATIVRELDLYARYINVQDDLLFIAHFSGTITVWNWKLKEFVTKFRGHLLRKSFASPIKSFRVDGLTIAMGFVDGYVAVLQLQGNELQLRGYIEPLWHGSSRDLRAVDIDDGRVAVGYEDAIVIWDVELMREVKTISWENEHLVELHFDNKQQKILVGNIFGNEFYMLDVRSGDVDHRFFLPDDATMTTISTDWRHYVVAGTWEGSIYAWSIDKEEPSKPVKIYQSEKPDIRHISQRSYRASGIDNLTFNGVYLTFIERFGINVKLLDLTS